MHPTEVAILCREYSIVKLHETGMFAMPLCCRSWGCDYCQPKRRRQVVAKAAQGSPEVFITLTVKPVEGEEPEYRARQLSRAWRLIVARAKRHYGYEHIPYFAVFEATKRGEPHLHILARVKWIDQGWLSRQLLDITGAYVVDIRKCRSSRQAARYMGKYLGKAPGKFGTLKRYWCTQSWSDTKAEYKEQFRVALARWTIEKRTINQILIHAVIQGWSCNKEGDLWTVVFAEPP